jgi:hypothetical protein
MKSRPLSPARVEAPSSMQVARIVDNQQLEHRGAGRCSAVAVASALRTEGGLPAMHAMDTSGATSCYFGGVLRCAKGRYLSRVEPYAIPDIRRAASAAFFMNSLNLLAVLMKCGFAFAYVSPSK